MGRSGFGATPINPPLAPFVKGGGPQDRGMLPSDCIFIRGSEFAEFGAFVVKLFSPQTLHYYA